MRKKERFVLGKRTFRSQKSKHFVLRIISIAMILLLPINREAMAIAVRILLFDVPRLRFSFIIDVFCLS